MLVFRGVNIWAKLPTSTGVSRSLPMKIFTTLPSQQFPHQTLDPTTQQIQVTTFVAVAKRFKVSDLGSFQWNMKRPIVVDRVFFGDEILHSYMRNRMNHYQYPYETTRIQWKVRPFTWWKGVSLWDPKLNLCQTSLDVLWIAGNFARRKEQDKITQIPWICGGRLFIECFFCTDYCVSKVSNQQFQGTILLMVFDSMGICMIRPFLAEFPYTLRGLVVIVCPNHNKHNLSTH